MAYSEPQMSTALEREAATKRLRRAETDQLVESGGRRDARHVIDIFIAAAAGSPPSVGFPTIARLGNRPADLAVHDCQLSLGAPILAADFPPLKKHIASRKTDMRFSR